MHKFFELISVGEEIIQEGTRFDAFKARAKATGSQISGGAKKAGGFLKEKGKTGGLSALAGAKKAGGFAKANALKVGKFAKANPGKVGVAAGIGAGGAFAAHRFAKKQESAISEGVGSALAGFGTKALGFGKKYGTQALGFGKKAGGEIGNIGRSTKNVFTGAGTFGARGRQFGRSLKANKLGAGALVGGAAGAGFGANKIFGRKHESELRGASANLEEARFAEFVKKIKEKGKAGGTAAFGGAKKAGGFLKEKSSAAGKAAFAGAKKVPPFIKANPKKSAGAALGLAALGGGAAFAKKRFGKEK